MLHRDGVGGRISLVAVFYEPLAFSMASLVLHERITLCSGDGNR